MDRLAAAFDQSLTTAAAKPPIIEAVRGLHEYETYVSEEIVERAPIRAKPSARSISERASLLLVTFEVSSEDRYKKAYRNPLWPRGRSGVTIGIGYDIGYATFESLKEDWGRYLDSKVLEMLSSACGVKGDAARQLVSLLRAVTISWEVAKEQFFKEVQPRYVGLTESTLENTSLLSPDALGALVSLTYNRGPSFIVPEAKDPTGRFAEMRAIKSLMASRDFAKVPDQIRCMKRIWKDEPGMHGLLSRREDEAQLFELGLAGKPQPK